MDFYHFGLRGVLGGSQGAFLRYVQLAGFFSNIILANSELTANNRLQVRKKNPLTAINGY